MSIENIAVIALCLFGGYWLVSFFFDRRKPAQSNPQPNPSTDSESTQPTHWAAILGVGASASMDEIRQAYRRRMSEYHPDKVAGLGAELRELAEKKAKEINGAYDEACRLRGESP